MLAIDRSYVNGKTHLVWDDGRVSFTEALPPKCFIFGSECCRSINNMGKLFLYEFPEIIPENFFNMNKTLGTKYPNWVYLMGKERFFSSLNGVIESYKKMKADLDPKVVKQQLKIECLIRMMQSVEYDVKKIDSEMLPKFKKFVEPHLNNGCLDPPSYIRTKTKTGRLTVRRGPSVLTMHANLRKGLVEAIQIDFCSMEPNLLLAFQERPTHADLYSMLAEDVFDGKLSRARVKLSVIASLYNSERRNKQAEAIAKFFRIDETVRFLEEQVSDGRIVNMYGRPIIVGDATKNHLLSLWLQSSAVDAALTGFCNLISSNKLIKPYWIIHDALIINKVDINVDHLDVGNNFSLPIKVGSFDEE